MTNETTNSHHTGEWMSGTIVVGVDGSPSSVQALRNAARLATLGSARVVAISVWQSVTFGVWTTSEKWPVKHAEDMLARAVRSVFGSETPEWFSSSLHEGTAAETLIAQSADADLLIVGTGGLGGFTGLLQGSVSAACVQHARCPVLVVHAEPRSRSVEIGKPEVHASRVASVVTS